MTTVVGKNGIRATVLLRSRSAITGIEFVTYEIEYPRIILAELNTHRMLPKNSASSRAIPFLKMLEQLHGQPVRFGQANPGMQDKGEDFDNPIRIESHLFGAFDAYLDWAHPGPSILDCLDADGSLLVNAQTAWEFARFLQIEVSKGLFEAGYHKQVYNRLTESSQMMKTVISGTEWANFFWLRNDTAADPTLAELARVMRQALLESSVQELQAGEWHLPYVEAMRGCDDEIGYFIYDESKHAAGDGGWLQISLEDAIKVSCARCAAVSFRNTDYMVEKSREVYDRLVGDERKHASAFEHCATPMQIETYDYESSVNISDDPDTWEEGITHMDRRRNLWSGPLQGFIQFRKLIPGENYTGAC